MGRKIPGKKHRGVKDPLVQIAKREFSLASKINAPPLNPDEQEVPKSVQKLIRLKQLTKDGKFDKRKRKRNRRKSKNTLINTAELMGREVKLPGMTRPDKTVPAVVQRPKETEKQFLYRVNRATQELINEVNFEDKYRVSVKRNEDTGEIMSVEKQKEDPIDAMYKEKMKELKHKKKKKQNNIEKGNVNSGLSKNAKRRLRIANRKAENFVDDKEDGFEKFKDEIKFGETVHEPPKFTALPKKAVKDADGRPGLKNNLLLKDLFKQQVSTKRDTSDKKILSGKRKNLSIGVRRMLENERNKAVAAYKQLKANRTQNR